MVSDVKELECWQLADRLRTAVLAICAHEKVARYFRFCDGFTDAAGSVCRNITEGFHRGGSPSLVQFCGYALGSIGEVADYLRESEMRGFIDKARLAELLELVEHTRAKTQNLRAYHQRKARAVHDPSPRTVFSYTVAD